LTALDGHENLTAFVMRLAFCKSSLRVTSDFIGFIVDIYGNYGVARECTDQSAVMANCGGTKFACMMLSLTYLKILGETINTSVDIQQAKYSFGTVEEFRNGVNAEPFSEFLPDIWSQAVSEHDSDVVLAV